MSVVRMAMNALNVDSSSGVGGESGGGGGLVGALPGCCSLLLR